MILTALLLLVQTMTDPPAPPESRQVEYRLSGARELRPAEIGDDGLRTYIRWDDEQEIPAVFAINAAGSEEMIDGYMRAGLYTIDRIIPRLVFRIDKRAARATRKVDQE